MKSDHYKCLALMSFLPKEKKDNFKHYIYSAWWKDGEESSPSDNILVLTQHRDLFQGKEQNMLLEGRLKVVGTARGYRSFTHLL